MFKFLILFFVAIEIATCQIVQTNLVEDIKDIVEKATENTLVIFDCDKVLLKKEDNIFRFDIRSAITNALKQELWRCNHNIIPIFQRRLYEIIWRDSISVLVNSEMPRIVSDIQDRGIKTMVLTAIKNEKLDKKWSIDLRINELLSLGFDFSKSWKEIDTPIVLGVYFSPCFKSGVLTSLPQTKGSALCQFLTTIPQSFKEIIFIDDNMNNLLDVAKFTKTIKINFKGIHYTKCFTLKKDIPNLEGLINFQLFNLIHKQIWISDEKALKEMEEDD